MATTKAKKNKVQKSPQEDQMDPEEVQEVDKTKELEDPDDISPETVAKMEATNATGVLIDNLTLEMRRGYREIKDFEDTIGIVRIYLPDASIDQELSDRKSELVAALLESDQIITREQVMDKLRSRKIWDDKKEELEKILTQDILEMMRDIMYEQHMEKIDIEKLKSLRKRRRDLEEQRTKLTTSRDYFTSACLESKVDTMLFKYQMTYCVKIIDKENEILPLWDDLEIFEHDERKYIVNRLSTLAGYFWNGWSEDLLQEALDI